MIRYSEGSCRSAVLSLLCCAGCAAGPAARTHSDATPALAMADETEVPARYDEGRWIVRPVTIDGDTLDLYTDSGGGVLFVARERLPRSTALSPGPATPKGDSTFAIAWPAFAPAGAFPPPVASSPMPLMTGAGAAFARMFTNSPARDGFLGNAFFAGRIWVFDYPRHRLSTLRTGTTVSGSGAGAIPLFFKNRSPTDDGAWFPRMRIAVDGDSLDLLLDTGATTLLTDSALAVIGDARPASRAASFITRTVADGWSARHPQWRVVRRAESGTGADMIEVPTIAIGGVLAGPVWFTVRADGNFSEYMSQWMDRPIVGALGGSGLRYYRVVADYPGRRALFSRQ